MLGKNPKIVTPSNGARAAIATQNNSTVRIQWQDENKRYRINSI